MCGRFNSHITTLDGWSTVLETWPDVKGGYNVAPTANISAFRKGVGEKMRWGLVPDWAESFETTYSTFNARIETVAEKPSFKSAWNKAQRCLIPMAGYYEWQGEKGNKQPYYVTDRFAGGLVMAGLYESWKLGGFLSCTILTKPADEAMSELHSRMPLLLSPDNAKDWLNCSDNLDIGEVANLTRPKLSFYKVGKMVNKAEIDNPNLIEPLRV